MNYLWCVLFAFAAFSLFYVPAGVIERIKGRELLNTTAASIVGVLEMIIWLLFLYYLWFSR